MDLLVLGANGLLGSNVVARGVTRGMNVTAGYHSEPPTMDIERVQVDITDTERLEAMFEATQPDAVVNCAAMTDVDGCERSRERAMAINGEAPGAIAELAARVGANLAHVSTDYVFDGTTESRYAEDDAPNPIQTYGESKLRGEQGVQAANEDAVIPRLSFVYGRHGSTGTLEGFPAWVRGRLSSGETVPAFTDQRVTPTRAGQAGEAILSLLNEAASGLVNVACRTCASPYEIAGLVAEIEDYDTENVVESRSTDIDRPASRPRRTCLDVSKVERLLDCEQPTLEDDLRTIL